MIGRNTTLTVDIVVLSVHVIPDLCLGHGLPHGLGRPRDGVGAEVDHGGGRGAVLAGEQTGQQRQGPHGVVGKS